MQTLEARGELDRAVEYLPDDMALAERRRRSQPLTRPELAVLLAYAKLSLNDDLLESQVPDDPYLGARARALFPGRRSRSAFPTRIAHHRLRREIIATQLANSMINRGGPSLVVRIADQTGASPAAIARGLRRGARQLRHDRAQRRDRHARQQDPRQAPARSLRRGAGSAARPPGLVPAQCRSDARASPTIVAHYRDGIAAVEAALDSALSPEAARRRATRARRRTDRGRRAGRARAPHRQPAGADGGARHRAGRRPHRHATSPT